MKHSIFPQPGRGNPRQLLVFLHSCETLESAWEAEMRHVHTSGGTVSLVASPAPLLPALEPLSPREVAHCATRL